MRKFVLLVVFVLALAGCGGDEEETPASTTEAETTQTESTQETTTTEQAEPNPETEPLPPDGDGSSEPESGPGGAGDEEPAQTLAMFTGLGGRLTPPVVRVPAFISVRVELHSGDGKAYALTIGGETIEVGGGLSSASTTIDGMRPGARLIGKSRGASNDVRIEATAEPGP